MAKKFHGSQFDIHGLNSPMTFSFDVRGQGSEVGRHWNDGSLGARARFEEKANPQPLLWIEDLRDEDEGTYRCRVDFKHAPTQNFRINLLVIGKIQPIRVPTLLQFIVFSTSHLEANHS